MENQTRKHSSAEVMRTAPLSQGTRDYLIVIGMFSDALSELYRTVEVQYPNCDNVINDASEKYTELEAELYKLLALEISGNMGFLDQTEI